ncbi:MAG: hypothetical protein VR65_28335 [Desulfobulbaceae bacterium BRH_c16a]|nr:MAG: hypothetical protein VR65_28335 [Desulfobulbaceae bacterium BRH_c16a]
MKMTHVIVEGHVQGVFFRSYTERQASLLNLNGWVRNIGNGTVEAMFAGADKDVAAMLEWLKIGSPGSRVDNLRVETVDSDEKVTSFEVRYNHH